MLHLQNLLIDPNLLSQVRNHELEFFVVSVEVPLVVLDFVVDVFGLLAENFAGIEVLPQFLPIRVSVFLLVVPTVVFEIADERTHSVDLPLQFESAWVFLACRQFHEGGASAQDLFELVASREYLSGTDFVLFYFLAHDEALTFLFEGHELVLILDLLGK